MGPEVSPQSLVTPESLRPAADGEAQQVSGVRHTAGPSRSAAANPVSVNGRNGRATAVLGSWHHMASAERRASWALREVVKTDGSGNRLRV